MCGAMQLSLANGILMLILNRVTEFKMQRISEIVTSLTLRYGNGFPVVK
jgi:hypothetical protein